MYTFLDQKNIYDLQFGFNLRQQNNTLHLIVLINITENTRKALDDRNIAWFLSSPSIIMGGFDLKICQNFVGTKFFLTFVGDKPLWGS